MKPSESGFHGSRLNVFRSNVRFSCRRVRGAGWWPSCLDWNTFSLSLWPRWVLLASLCFDQMFADHIIFRKKSGICFSLCVFPTEFVQFGCDEVVECFTSSSNCSVCSIGNKTLCVCNSGFHSNGSHCINLNECSQPDLHSCPTNANCIDTLGSYYCECQSGYTANGQNCTNINECDDPDACSAQATCADTKGSFECICNEGFVGSGYACENTDECQNGQNNCSPDAECFDTVGSYLCSCKHGYVGDGVNCSPIKTCTIGTFLSQDGTCIPCPLNTYNDRQEHILYQCFPCQPGLVTQTVGSVSGLQCICGYFSLVQFQFFPFCASIT